MSNYLRILEFVCVSAIFFTIVLSFFRGTSSHFPIEDLLFLGISSILILIVSFWFTCYEQETSGASMSPSVFRRVRIVTFSFLVISISAVWLRWESIKMLLRIRNQNVIETLTFLCTLSFLIGVTLIVMSFDNKRSVLDQRGMIPNHRPYFFKRVKKEGLKQNKSETNAGVGVNAGSQSTRKDRENKALYPIPFLPVNVLPYGTDTLGINSFEYADKPFRI